MRQRLFTGQTNVHGTFLMRSLCHSRACGHGALLLSALLGVAAAGCSERPTSGYHGFAEGEYIRVASPFAGNVAALDVQRGVTVEAGDRLFALENENETAARREAEERLRNAESTLANLQKGRRPTELQSIGAQLEQARAARRLSQAQLARTEQLVAKNFISKAQLDEARSAAERDRARVEQLEAELATAKLAAREDEIRAAKAAVAAAQAVVQQADWRLRQKSAASPAAGLVTETYYVKGEWVQAGMPIVALLPPENIKIRFFVPETDAGALKIGESVNVACDGCGAPLSARVSYVSPQAEYTPPVIYSRESRAKLVYLIEARPAPADAAKLHPGQPVDVTRAGS